MSKLLPGISTAVALWDRSKKVIREGAMKMTREPVVSLKRWLQHREQELNKVEI